MIDLGNELNGYGEGDENSDVTTGFNITIPENPYVTVKPTYNIGVHSIGRLTDLQKGGFNTVAPHTYRAYRAIQQVKNMVDLITREKDT